MQSLLIIFIFIVSIIVITGVINEKFFKISNNIALLIVSFLISIIFVLLNKFNMVNDDFVIFKALFQLKLDEFLLEGVLCFMIFAGASKLQFYKFVSNFKSISILSIYTTIISTLIYGVLIYGVSVLLNLNFDIAICFLIGSIISPTDPIAATGILSKLGLPKSLSSVLEGESLFNDGIGVALFAFISNIIMNVKNENFMLQVGKNILLAVIIGLIISYLLFKLTKKTKNPTLHILISLLNVSLCYVICEQLGVSGVIASVVCGIYFSYKNQKAERWKKVVDPNNLYVDFWDTIDELLNSTLFVLIGLTAFIIPVNSHMVWILPVAIVVNFASRYISVLFTGLLLGKNSLPNKYRLKDFTSLMTFSAMRGGVSLAMAFSTSVMLPLFEYNIVLSITLVTILFTTIVQGMLLPLIFKKIQEDSKGKSLIKTKG